MPHALAEGLRRRGIDVSTTTDAGLMASDDLEQLRFASTERRVLITRDADFLRLHQAGARHAGIVYCHTRHRSVGPLLQALVLLWEAMSSDEMSDHVEFV
jgi:predicted nuclease of predicted toxin-antitoxin system